MFISPQRYIQGKDVLISMGRYLSLLSATRAAVLISERGNRSEGVQLKNSLETADIEPVVSIFNGECSIEEIESQAQIFADQEVDCLLAVGGGKCVDTGKAVAFRLGVPVVIVPTLASNDAPCSALSVLYSPEGVTTGAEFYPQNPALVVVDTAVIAGALPRRRDG